MNLRLAEWERRGDVLLPRYVLFWLGGCLLLDVIVPLASLRGIDIFGWLPERLLTWFLDGVHFGVAHLLCFFVLGDRGFLARRSPVAGSVWIGSALGFVHLAAVTPRDPAFVFRLVEGLPLVLPFLAAAWAVGRAMTRRRGIMSSGGSLPDHEELGAEQAP